MPIIIACAMLDEACYNGVALILDITPRKEMEKALKKSEMEYKYLVNCAPTPIFEIDFEGPSFKNVNEAFCKLLSCSKTDILSKNPLDILDENSRADFNEKISLAKNGEKIDENIEYQFVDSKGRLIWVLLNIKLIYVADKLDGALLVGHNITERKQVENLKQKLFDQEKKLTEKLQTSNEKLISTTNKLQLTNKELVTAQTNLKNLVNQLMISNKELEQFAYVASHDLQEPLRMVSSFTQLLERRYKDKLDDSADEYIDFIVEGAKRMKNLIDDLLSYSRLNNRTTKFQWIDLNDCLDVVLLDLNSSINESNTTIQYENLPEIKGDPMQIKQLLQNLIGNAIKFQGQDHIKIIITGQKFENHWLITVGDNGIGIDPKYHDQIFDIFKRLHTRKEYDGTGMGLSICKRIIERHNGNIWVESELGKGATFCFTISENADELLKP
ncbi:MAG: ATP-binding protein [Methanobacterium sp. ERen5]|nr:MAG: ATP-binding protein [Methanobacterium sp. ERen5]